jgi:alpha-tubulin suppressor-like RCC1 family protein
LLPREIEALRGGVNVASVSAGQEHVLALTYTGDVYSWGDVLDVVRGALGHGRPPGGFPLTSFVHMLPTRIEELQGVRVRCISAASMHSCAVTFEGHVYTWGCGYTGVLGHMEFEGEELPKRVEMLYDNHVFVVGVSAGDKHTLVADADGAVWGFGNLNAIGAWGDPTVKAMHDDEDDTVEDNGGLFGVPD